MELVLEKQREIYNQEENANKLQGEQAVKKTERNSSFELLRIFAMFLIILHHFVLHGGGLNIGFDVSLNRYAAQVMVAGNCIGINLFFMLSGYFLVSAKFNVKRLVRLDLSTIFYAVLTLLATTLIWKNPDGYKWLNWLKSCVPVIYHRYWFISVYAAVYLLFPFFNKLIGQLDKKYFTLLAGMMFVMVCIIPAVKIDTTYTMFTNQFLTGVFGYFAGAYIRKYPIKLMDNICVPLVMFMVSYALVCAVSAAGAKHEALQDNSPLIIIKGIVMNNNMSLLNVTAPVSLMMLCRNIKLGVVRPINFIAQCCMGVYLIHDAPALRAYLWNNIVKAPELAHGGFYPAKALAVSAAVFAACAAIELIRIYTIEKPMLKIKKCDRLFAQIDKFMNNI